MNAAHSQGTALVTGSGGFIGRHLVARLRDDGYRVTALTRAACDLTDEAAVRRTVSAIGPDVVFHLAASRGTGDAAARATTVAVNTLSGFWVTESVGDRCRAIVAVGSSTEYASSDRPMDEATPLQPRGTFGRTKAAGTLLVATAAAERGIPCRIVRPFQVYGPGDKQHRFVPAVLAAARTARPLPLTLPGMCRDWVWVGDVVDACVRAASSGSSRALAIWNIGTGVETTNEDLVRSAERATGRRIRTEPGALPPREWDTGHWVSESAAARRDLGWEPTVELAEGLKRCWAAA